jgi:hypothetical protein
MMFCSIIGRLYPVFAVSSGMKTTADNPDNLHTTFLHRAAAGGHS